MTIQAFSAFVVVATLFLIIAGGLVTSTGSGLSVPDWPLSFGQWMPPMQGGVFYEHGHRMIAATVGLLTVLLAIWVWTDRRTSSTAKKLAVASVVAVIVQGILGGVTVLLKLPVLVSVSHAVLGQLFFTLNACLAVVLTAPVAGEASPKVRRLAWLTFGFILFQLILGAFYRHSGQPHVLYTHMAVASLVLIHVVLLWKRIRNTQGVAAFVRTVANVLFSLVLAQIVLGIISWQLPYIGVTTAHVAVGALLLAGSAVIGLLS